MWVLALGGAFLAVAKACIFCRLQDHALANRLAQLNNQTKPKWKWKEWASPDFSAFALDEVSMKQVTEKTHRVLRVIEKKGSTSLIPLYWQWLQKTRIPQYTREALCAPVCRGSTILYNCSTCEGKEESCWPQKHCYPDSHDLWDARILLLCIFGIVLLSGVVSLQVEYLNLQAKDL
ncbi:sperm-egg fusion protein TMEM95 precursor [Mus musculus]|uniref:Sperm-egg fusion protein TMEM95 n=1 Tax=Mus musculus TaxID=10090 RepID=TMM95_MOUSE|nr:sperm-egg fusion protein TMEM95 precursor [Mus musculus]P0DJF3.1 RecName: Full=Sperm-egg fusion protein TMEM95; AltName: Full=Transmembrane protein 95; Flags: Precursor [Mus musculus]|eukprot:NP_001182639.1 transmembrane protein 95 precursor [Mus musculus]